MNTVDDIFSLHNEIVYSGKTSYSGLIWFPGCDIGFCPDPQRHSSYSDEYFRKFEEYDRTEMGSKITSHRVATVDLYWTGSVIDIGCGTGAFVKLRKHDTKGYDVSSYGARVLSSIRRYVNPYNHEVECDALSFWDSLEHIIDPRPLLWRVKKYVFMTIPICKDAKHAIEYKHWKPKEHYWHFTHIGLLGFMDSFGFTCKHFSSEECLLGREDVGTYVFEKTNPGVWFHP